jgi:hypothetical protein
MNKRTASPCPSVLLMNRSYWPDAEATGQLLTELCEDLTASFLGLDLPSAFLTKPPPPVAYVPPHR